MKHIIEKRIIEKSIQPKKLKAKVLRYRYLDGKQFCVDFEWVSSDDKLISNMIKKSR